jgi:hypothetical protein
VFSVDFNSRSRATEEPSAKKSTTPLPTALRFILISWVLVWAFFLVWPLGKDPARLAQALSLVGASAERRQSIVFGEEFYEFLHFCKDRLPADSTFRLAGIDYASIDKVRAFYVLYPRLVAAEHAQFILVYRKPGYHEDGAQLYARLNSGTFILKTTQSGTP